MDRIDTVSILSESSKLLFYADPPYKYYVVT